MSAQTIHYIGFLARSQGREPDDRAAHPVGAAVVRELLREWRAAERDLAEVDPGSEAWARLKTEIDRLRQRYQEAFDEMSDSGPTGSTE